MTTEQTFEKEDLYKQRKHKFKNKHGIKLNEAVTTERLLIVVLVTLNILLSVLIGIVIQYKQLQSEQLGQRSTLTNILIPCDDLSLSLDEDAETFDGKRNKFKHFVDANGTSICIFTNITDIISKKVERASRIRLAKGLTFKPYHSCGNQAFAPKSGHMTAFLSKLSTRQPEQKDKKQVQLINWEVTPDHSFAGTGVKFNKGRIQVTENKFYFVYAIITFNNTIWSGDCGSDIFRVSIYKTNVMYDGSYESRELQERETLCNRTNGISTLYIGSHVNLDKGDIIYVKVSDVSRVVQVSRGSALGLFPLH